MTHPGNEVAIPDADLRDMLDLPAKARELGGPEGHHYWTRYYRMCRNLGGPLAQEVLSLRKRIAELEAQVAEARMMLSIADVAKHQSRKRQRFHQQRRDWLALTAPKDQCRVDVGGYPCEEPRPCAEHDRTAPKEAP